MATGHIELSGDARGGATGHLEVGGTVGALAAAAVAATVSITATGTVGLSDDALVAHGAVADLTSFVSWLMTMPQDQLHRLAWEVTGPVVALIADWRAAVEGAGVVLVLLVIVEVARHRQHRV